MGCPWRSGKRGTAANAVPAGACHRDALASLASCEEEGSGRCANPGRSAVLVGVVGLVGDPESVEHADPGPREDAGRMRVVATSCPGTAIDVGSPGRCVSRVVGEGCEGSTQPMVAGPSAGDTASFAGR